MKHYTLKLNNPEIVAEERLWQGLKDEAPSVLAVLDFAPEEARERFKGGIEYDGENYTNIMWFHCRREQFSTVLDILEAGDGVIKVECEGRVMDTVVRVKQSTYDKIISKGLLLVDNDMLIC